MPSPLRQRRNEVPWLQPIACQLSSELKEALPVPSTAPPRPLPLPLLEPPRPLLFLFLFLLFPLFLLLLFLRLPSPVLCKLWRYLLRFQLCSFPL